MCCSSIIMFYCNMISCPQLSKIIFKNLNSYSKCGSNDRYLDKTYVVYVHALKLHDILPTCIIKYISIIHDLK